MIEKHLIDFLNQENSLTIENLGTFQKNYTSSQLKDGKLLPPEQQISFDANNKSEETAFRDYVLAKENIDEQSYKNALADFVEHIQNQIQEKGSFSLSTWGKLTQQDGQLLWQANPDSFGLPPLQHQPIYAKTDKKDKPMEAESKKNKELILWFFIVIAVFFVAFFGYLLTQRDAWDKFRAFLQPERKVLALDQLQDTQANTFKTEDLQENADDSSTQDEQAAPDDTQNTDEQNTNEQPVVDTNENTDTKTNEKVENTEQQTGNFYLIAGSFSDKKLAEALRAKLEKKGFSPKILPAQENMFRVSLAQYEDLATAQQKAKELESTVGSLWVMRKK